MWKMHNHIQVKEDYLVDQGKLHFPINLSTNNLNLQISLHTYSKIILGMLHLKLFYTRQRFIYRPL